MGFFRAAFARALRLIRFAHLAWCNRDARAFTGNAGYGSRPNRFAAASPLIKWVQSHVAMIFVVTSMTFAQTSMSAFLPPQQIPTLPRVSV